MPSGNTDPRSPVETAAAAADLPFDIDEDELVIDEEGGGDVDVEHATNELFSPVIVSTCSLNKKEDERRSSMEGEKPGLQSEEPSKVRWFLSFVGLQRNYTPVELVQVRHFEFDSIEYIPVSYPLLDDSDCDNGCCYKSLDLTISAVRFC